MFCAGFDKEKTTMDELLEYYAEHEPAIVHIQVNILAIPDCLIKYIPYLVPSAHRSDSTLLLFLDEKLL